MPNSGQRFTLEFVEINSGKPISGTVTVDGKYGDYILEAHFAGRQETSRAHLYWPALCQLRQEVETAGFLIACKGSRIDVHPSGMMMDSGVPQAYLVKIGVAASLDEVVDIFSRETDLNSLATVDEQDEHFQLWLSTPRA